MENNVSSFHLKTTLWWLWTWVTRASEKSLPEKKWKEHFKNSIKHEIIHFESKFGAREIVIEIFLRLTKSRRIFFLSMKETGNSLINLFSLRSQMYFHNWRSLARSFARPITKLDFYLSPHLLYKNIKVRSFVSPNMNFMPFSRARSKSIWRSKI